MSRKKQAISAFDKPRVQVPGRARAERAMVVTTLEDLPLSDIRPNPDQPRRAFDEEFIAELAQSLQDVGLQHPINVTPDGDGFMIISGENRYRAATKLGWETIRAIVETNVDLSDYKLAVRALTENVMRQNLNVVDETEAIFKLIQSRAAETLGEEEASKLDYQAIEQTLTRMRNHLDGEPTDGLPLVIAEVIGQFGWSWRKFSQKRAAIWRWPAEIVDAMRARTISLAVAQILQGIKDDKRRAHWLKRAIDENLGAIALRSHLKEEGRQALRPAPKQARTLAPRFQRALTRIEKLDDSKLAEKLAPRLERADKLLAEIEKLLGDE